MKAERIQNSGVRSQEPEFRILNPVGRVSPRAGGAVRIWYGGSSSRETGVRGLRGNLLKTAPCSRPQSSGLPTQFADAPEMRPDSNGLSLYSASSTPYSFLRRAAFTLLEIVVSTAIVAIISLILLQIISSMLDATRAETARMDAYSNGRTVLELMARDIRQTWVERASTSNNPSWTGIPAGTEFNWRNLHAQFARGPHYHLNTDNPMIFYSGAIPVVRGDASSGLRVVGYGISNGLLLRYQAVLEDSDAVERGLWSASGVTNNNFTITNYPAAVASAEVIAENIYWFRLDGPNAITNGLPDSVTMTLRAAPKEMIERIRKNPSLTNDLLFLTDEVSSTTNPNTKANIREITLKIPFQ